MVAVSRLRSLPCFSNIWRGYYLLSPLRKPLWLVLPNFIQKIYVHISMNYIKEQIFGRFQGCTQKGNFWCRYRFFGKSLTNFVFHNPKPQNRFSEKRKLQKRYHALKLGSSEHYQNINETTFLKIVCTYLISL